MLGSAPIALIVSIVGWVRDDDKKYARAGVVVTAIGALTLLFMAFPSLLC